MANKEELLTSIRKAMQGEKDSYALYLRAADGSSDPQVKDFFAERSAEEKLHYNYLLKYYQEIPCAEAESDLTAELSGARKLPRIFSPEFIKRIGSDQYLFSAISTALLLEKDAFAHYQEMAAMTDSMTLKSFFELLANWEMAHYDELLGIQKEAELYYWEINGFEPM